jgi:hypothetical protein
MRDLNSRTTFAGVRDRNPAAAWKWFTCTDDSFTTVGTTKYWEDKLNIWNSREKEGTRDKPSSDEGLRQSMR